MTFPTLRGRRVLVVEDEPLIALQLVEYLETCDATVLRAGTLAAAMTIARDRSFDVASLDIQLGFDEVWPLARKLVACGVPFLFASGAARQEDIPDDLRGIKRFGKPFEAHAVAHYLAWLAETAKPWIETPDFEVRPAVVAAVE